MSTGSGFIGGIIAGFLAGYVAKLISSKLKLPQSMEALKPILIIPLISSLVVGLAMIYLIGKPVAGILEGLTHWLQTMGTANAVLLGAILGGMMCTDMGGPVNKAAYAFGVGLLSTQTYAPMAAIMAAGMVPPLALGLATIIARRKFDKAQQEGGKAALVLGLCFITEGAIPFAARDPMRVLPCCIVGGAVTGAISMAVGAKLMAPHGGLFVLLIPGAITPVLGYLLAIVAGTLVAGLSYAVLKRPEAEVVDLQKSRVALSARLFLCRLFSGLLCLQPGNLFCPDIRIDGFQHHWNAVEAGILHDKAERIVADITFAQAVVTVYAAAERAFRIV